jgi:hypothetical protein
MWGQENHADKLREGGDEVDEDEGEEGPKAIGCCLDKSFSAAECQIF